MTASTATAPKTFEELGARKVTRVEFKRTMSAPKGERSVRTEWVLSERELPGGKVEKVVLQFDSRHWPERKRMSSRLGYFLRSTEPGSPFVTETYSLFEQTSLLVRSTPVARYSAKALLAEHEVALEELAAHFEPAAQVAAEAMAKYPMEV